MPRPTTRTSTSLIDDERESPAVHVHMAAPEAEVDLDADAAGGRAYHFPSIELLEQAESDQQVDMDEIEENKQTLLDKLETYNIQITEIDAVVGPTVTRYELTPAPGIKISRITALEDDLAMALAAPGIRIIAPIPGKSAIGVEIPNRSREMVRLRQTLSTPTFRDAARGGKMALPIPIGKTIEGGVYVEDLAKMPHLLVAGATGSGKSVGVNALIVGLLYAKQPARPQVRHDRPEEDRAQRLRDAAEPLLGDAHRRRGPDHHGLRAGRGRAPLVRARDGAPLRPARRGGRARHHRVQREAGQGRARRRSAASTATSPTSS